MDARNMQFLDETFDTATAFFSLMYLKSETDRQKVLAEVYRALKPAGRFLVMTEAGVAASASHRMGHQKRSNGHA
jgi:ubiquinone/menaquinone biosynthesis C-methylase UbiE